LAVDHLNRLRKKQKKQERALKQALRRRGSNDLQTASARLGLAITLKDLGLYAESLDLLRLAILAPASPWDDHRVGVFAEHHMSNVLWELGQRDESIRVLEHLVLTTRQFRGDRDRSTTWAMVSLGMRLRRRDKFGAALQVLEAVLVANPLGSSAEVENTLHAVQGVANVRWDLGEFEVAQRCQEQVVSGSQRILGAKHPVAAARSMKYAFMMSENGDSAGAVPRAEAILAAVLRSFGEHPDLAAQCRVTSARIYHSAGRSDEANELVNGALRQYYSAGRIVDDDLFNRRSTCAIALDLLGRHEEARVIWEAGLQYRLTLLGDDEPESIKAKAALAQTLCALGQSQQARNLQEQVLASLRRDFGDDYFRTNTALKQLSITLGELHEYETARRLAESAWNGLQRIFGDSHRWTLEAKENLERMGGAIRRLPDDPT
jgi:tetratricopeptide (TPR) repeat protein